MEDTREELERLEQELLAEEPVAAEELTDTDEQLLDELIQEVKAEQADEDVFLDDAMLREVLSEDAAPAFEDPDKIHEPEELIYSNYANDYGKDIQDDEYADEEQEQQAAEDRLQIILMIAASALSLGIIGILIYWLVAFF